VAYKDTTAVGAGLLFMRSRPEQTRLIFAIRNLAGRAGTFNGSSTPCRPDKTAHLGASVGVSLSFVDTPIQNMLSNDSF
jgi:hypothetical protein